MAFLSGLGRMARTLFDPDRLATAQAFLNNDPGTVSLIQSRSRALAAERAQAEHEADARGAQMEALAGLGWSKPQIAALGPGALSGAMLSGMTPEAFAGSVDRITPGLGDLPGLDVPDDDDADGLIRRRPGPYAVPASHRQNWFLT